MSKPPKDFEHPSLLVKPKSNQSDWIRARFLVEERKQTLRNIRLSCVLGAILVPLFSILDFFAYPQYFWDFFALRVICTLLVMVSWQVAATRFGKKHFRMLTIVAPLIPGFFISVMIGLSSDPGSPYYAGLTLCLVAMGIVFRWTYREALVCSIVLLLLYVAFCFPSIRHGAEHASIVAFVNNVIFLLANGTVVTAGCLTHSRLQFRGFVIRDQLRRSQLAIFEKNQELESLVNELKETEGQLIQSEKMASLGRLSAGVIHEIGNPLNYATQDLFLLRKKLVKNSEAECYLDKLDDIKEGHERIKDIVSELRDFSHKGGQKLVGFEVEEAIQSALRMLSKEITYQKVETIVENCDSPLVVQGVKNQVSQVIINLVQNSVHALQGQPSPVLTIRSSAAQGMAKIEIVDNGEGIPSSHLPKLFDPFFTSKDVGEGTGLGLSICYRIIESHGGRIEVDSVVDEYTRFTLYLPIEVERKSVNSVALSE